MVTMDIFISMTTMLTQANKKTPEAETLNT